MTDITLQRRVVISCGEIGRRVTGVSQRDESDDATTLREDDEPCDWPGDDAARRWRGRPTTALTL